MALSALARQFAAEIKNHDWSDAPYRADRAGHNREHDNRAVPKLEDPQTDNVRMNVMWVTAQVLGYQDPSLKLFEFAEACGVNIYTSRGAKSGVITSGVRTNDDGHYAIPGTPDSY
ncbi:hypothetical protein [Streptomyces liliifuscus]|uniref:Uncharacterized protein n=1 Tax=Streptomyces liliifuscus TaxID=2797636 RepID=A0A7T7L2F7_9ACTN|nr:hypothetical protein [Streptomyces liliifuscus]QQM45233.1 hypothetical protein JEQ17_41380 [Streptomyces liliifuscus]